MSPERDPNGSTGIKTGRNEVARAAGVSTATVSRVFNDPTLVSEEKRRRVMEAVRRLGYSPNKFASALARNSSGRILFVDCNKLSAHDAENADFYASMYKNSLEAVLRVIDTSPYHLSIDLDGAAGSSGFDGIILFDVDSREQAEAFTRDGVPVVCGHHTAHFTGGRHFSVDNVAGGRNAARILMETGHGNPAYITGKLSEISSHHDRLAGFLDVYGERDVRVVEGKLGPAGGEESAEVLLPALGNRKIDCIAVVNDLTAFGVVRKLLSSGIRIPEDVSVISFDNLPILRLLPVRLSTFDLGLGRLYGTAARFLLDDIRTSGETCGETAELIEPVPVTGGSVRNRLV